MKLTYETGTATLIQFIALGLLNLGNTGNSVVTVCGGDSGDCVGNILTSIIFYIILAVWFGFICLLGYTAQHRRSRRLALLLMGCEGMVMLISYFNARHHTDFIGLITSIVDLILALWVIFLAFRIVRARGQRITTSGRSRRRRKASTLDT